MRNVESLTFLVFVSIVGITFSTFGRLFFKLDDYFTEEELMKQIDIIDQNYMGGHTDTAHGLQLVLDLVCTKVDVQTRPMGSN